MNQHGQQHPSVGPPSLSNPKCPQDVSSSDVFDIVGVETKLLRFKVPSRSASYISTEVSTLQNMEAVKMILFAEATVITSDHRRCYIAFMLIHQLTVKKTREPRTTLHSFNMSTDPNFLSSNETLI